VPDALVLVVSILKLIKTKNGITSCSLSAQVPFADLRLIIEVVGKRRANEWQGKAMPCIGG